MSERPTGAAEKAVPRQNEGYSTDPHLGETAYAPRHRLYLVSPRPVPVSHPPAVEASPRGLAPQAPALPLGRAAPGLGPAHPDLGLRRLPGRALPHGPRRLFRLPPEGAPPRQHLGRLPAGPGPAAPARAPRLGPRRPRPAGRPLPAGAAPGGRPGAAGLRRHPPAVPA